MSFCRSLSKHQPHSLPLFKSHSSTLTDSDCPWTLPSLSICCFTLYNEWLQIKLPKDKMAPLDPSHLSPIHTTCTETVVATVLHWVKTCSSPLSLGFPFIHFHDVNNAVHPKSWLLLSQGGSDASCVWTFKSWLLSWSWSVLLSVTTKARRRVFSITLWMSGVQSWSRIRELITPKFKKSHQQLGTPTTSVY